MRLTGKVEVHLNSRAMRAAGQGFARDVARQLGELTLTYAKRNVTPGKGPGPHPHRPPPFRQHTDTGELVGSLQAKPVEQGFLTTYQVYTDIDYGVYLEVGWHSLSGNFWRYPWLEPAVREASQHLAEIAKSTGRAYFTGGRSTRPAGRVNLTGASFATFFPGVPMEVA